MAETNGAGEAQQITRESLLPPGWEERLLNGTEDESETTQAADAETDESASEETQGDESESEASEATLGRMKLADFLDEAGVTPEEFYSNVYVMRDGKEISVSQAWDDEKSATRTVEALSRERDELQARLNQAATTQAPPGTQSVEALLLARQAEECQKVLESTDWTQFDPAQASAEQLKYINLRDSLVRQAQTKHQEFVQEQQTQVRTLLEEADRQTRAIIPEWNDQKVRDSEWQSMKDLGAKYGFKSEEMEAWQDPRARRMLRDFWQSQQTVAKVKAGATKIRKVGKTLGAGTRDTAKGRPSLADASRAIREASDNTSKSKIRQTMDLGDLPPIQQPTK